MSAKPCGCSHRRARVGGETSHCPAGGLRRGRELAGWVLPTATLALMPKCPACIAGYIALFTGIGVSLTVATFLRWALVILCVSSLTYVANRRLRRRSCP